MKPAFLLFPLTLAACQLQPDTPRTGPAHGLALFQQDCAICHADDATGGDGPDLTRLSARNGGVFPTTRVLAQIDPCPPTCWPWRGIWSRSRTDILRLSPGRRPSMTLEPRRVR